MVKKEAEFIQMDSPNTMPHPCKDVPEVFRQVLSKKPKSILKNNQAYFAVDSDEDDV